MKITKTKETIHLSSPDYNFAFNNKDGLFLRWGKTYNEDPTHSPFGPEIVDIEVSTICGSKSGVSTKYTGNCDFCYKDNTHKGHNMDIHTFTEVMKYLPETVTQIAFGIGDLYANTSLPAIIRYTRDRGIVPNITVNGNNIIKCEGYACEILRPCGAIAVSCTGDLAQTIRIVQDLKKCTQIEQVNIHYVVHSKNIHTLINDLTTHEKEFKRVGVNAIVFLGLKPKGRALHNNYKPADNTKFTCLVQHCLKANIPFGFDSCSAPKFELAISRLIESPEEQAKYTIFSESCESGLFSAYVNVHGEFFPCSFVENTPGWETGLPVIGTSFLDDVWNHPRTAEWRKGLLHSCNAAGCRRCLVYPEINP